eukprot:2853996-Heterocapsa_arctica.AAC.1
MELSSKQAVPFEAEFGFNEDGAYVNTCIFSSCMLIAKQQNLHVAQVDYMLVQYTSHDVMKPKA